MFQNLKNEINQYIKTNGARSITGALLNGVLNDMVDALGAVGGYGGIITPTSAAPQSDGNVFFVSNTAGTYTNFSNIVVNENELAFIYRSGNGWAKDGITLSAGGTNVVANPAGEATETLNKIGIGDTIYTAPQGAPGQDGQDGQNGITPNIGVNGNWYIGDQDTGVHAQGPAGQDGEDGQNGITPTINPDNKHWMIGETDTGVVAEGQQGATGATGATGPQGPTGATGPQGPQGNTGSSVDYPFTLVNNLETNDATQALTSAMGVSLNAKAEKLRLEKLDKTVGKNLYNVDAAMVNYRLDTTTGKPKGASNWKLSDFIPCIPTESYVINGGYNAHVGFYDANFIFQSESQYTANTAFSVPAGCYYLRFEIGSSYGNVQLEHGNAATPYVAYDDTYSLLGPIKSSILNKVDKAFGHQLFDKTVYSSGFIKNTGGTQASDSYRISNYIPVEVGENYYISAKGDSAVSGSTNTYFWFYDGDKNAISGSGVQATNKQATAPTGAVYLRISYDISKQEIMVEKGTARSQQYEEFSEIAGYLPILRDKQVEIRHLSDALHDKIFSGDSFSGFADSGIVAASASLELGICRVKKNYMLVANIAGTVDDIKVGFGPSNIAMAGYVELTASTLKLYDGTTKFGEFSHGLTLTQDTTITLCTKTDGPTTINFVEVSDGLGNSFGVGEGFSDAWPSGHRMGLGQPYITNAGSASITANLSFFPMDICAKIWIFGDSYVSMGDPARFPYYLFQRHMDRWLLNGYTGEGAGDALTDFQTLLTKGHKPTYAVWMMGMNGANDTGTSGNYTIAESQATTINNFLAICDENGITPILEVVPTVPSRQRTGYDSFVRNKGVRVIDFATAVGTNENGQWKTGLLESGNQVHPTIAGAKVLADRFLLDFPEASIILQ